MGPIENEIRDQYKIFANKFGMPTNEFPYEFDVEPYDYGKYVKVSSTGSISLISNDRGKEVSRYDAKDIDDLLYVIFRSVSNSRAANYEMGIQASHPNSEQLAFARALEEIAKASDKWRDRLKKEQQEILEETALDDD